MKITHYKSLEHNYWKKGSTNTQKYEDFLSLTGEKKQKVKGFGGCFNEIGWDILQTISKKDRGDFFDELFLEENCGFQMGRVPIGANDFSLQWYSCDEADNDYELKDFSIERDKKFTIPYVKEALKRQKELTLFASPWSPPIWMKTKKVYNYGTIRMEKKILEVYARYLIQFVKEYEKEEVFIQQIHVQNEPMADQKFPSCLWTGEQMRDFIKYYLGPTAKKEKNPPELWVGTINGPFVDFMMGEDSAPFHEHYDQFENTILSDKEARNYITGVGFQWGGKHAIEETTFSYPELRYMQTESECGDGNNTWEHAEYIYRQMWNYFHHGVESYLYWNLALPEDESSTWGWSQNSLITVNKETKQVTYQPEFYLMKHFSHFVKKGARVLETKGHFASNAVVFENPDTSLVIVVGNNMNQQREFMFEDKSCCFSAILEAHSIHTFLVEI